MRWRLARRQKALARRRAELAEVLNPLLMAALVPMAEAMSRLDQRQQETQGLVLRLEQQHQAKVRLEQVQLVETRELLTEVLNSLQPTAEEQLVPQLAPSMRPRSSPSSVS